MRVRILQHVPFEGPASIARWAEARGVTLETTHLYRNDALSDPAAFDALIVLGGPMGVHDEAEYPWMGPEKTLLRRTLEADRPVLGVCLGAQFLADVMGAAVHGAPHREIGWYPVSFTDEALALPGFADFPSELEVMHWHGDTFEVPQGCVPVGASAGCANQGFVHSRRPIAGFQFHMEWDRETAAALTENCVDDLAPGPFTQSTDAILVSEDRFEAMNAWMFRFLDNWLLARSRADATASAS